MNRRRFVAGSGAALLAGCVGASTDQSGATERGTDSRGRGSLDNHPAARDLDAQPARGDPRSAPGVIVAFEDPFCPRCARFESQTVPKLRSELVDTGKASFVFRGYPVTYPARSEPATRALEATFTRNPDAHWMLAEFFFENQTLSADEVLPEAERFLEERTAVDGSAVVSAVREGEADDAVQADRTAGEAAGLSATPSVVLFRDGEYRTTFQGSAGFEELTAALGF